MGVNLYFGKGLRLNCKGILTFDILTSVKGAIGRSNVYGGLTDIGDRLPGQIIYLRGDVIGLIVCLIVLKPVVRWQRFSSGINASRGSDEQV